MKTLTFRVWLTALGWIVVVSIASAEDGPKPLDELFLPEPFISTAMMGTFSTGLAFADLDNDGYADMIVSNGNDMSPQPLTVFRNRTAGGKLIFAPYPSWYSENIGYMMRLAVGDVNSDGWLDVAVTLAFDEHRRPGGGGVAVYLNRAGTLESRPSFRTGHYSAAGCAFGDVDADGDLDLVVAAALERREWFPLDGRARIYLNRGGRFDDTPAWTSRRLECRSKKQASCIQEQALGTMDVVVADVNQDGWMDVAVAANRIAVYYGHQPDQRPGKVPIPTAASWLSKDSHQYSFSIDAGSPRRVEGSKETKTPSGEPLLLVVSSGCVGEMGVHVGSAQCTSSLRSYRPKFSPGTVVSESFTWCLTDKVTNPAEVLLADLNDDGHLDLIANQWGPMDHPQGILPENNQPPPAGLPGASLWMFEGLADGFPLEPTYVSSTRRVGEEIAVADLCSRGVKERKHTFRATTTGAVVTLPERIVLGVESVRRFRQDEIVLLAASEYAWASASNWISLASPLEVDERLEVKYRFSPLLDVGEATWDPQHGNNIYRNLLEPEKECH